MAATDKTRVSVDATSQAQSGSSEKGHREPAKPVSKKDEIKFFDMTITKLVDRENPDTGETETVEVLSDNLYPGERLRHADDEAKAEAKKKARQATRGTDK